MKTLKISELIHAVGETLKREGEEFRVGSGAALTDAYQSIVDGMMKDANPLITVDTSPQKTLRDEIAIEAMVAMIAKHQPYHARNEEDADKFALRIAKGAYRYADAMLKAREGV